MNPVTVEQIESSLKQAVPWAIEQEQIILRTGVALTESQASDAKRVGVRKPECIRLCRVAVIEMPSFITDLMTTPANQTTIWGITFRYGIYLREDRWNWRKTLVHELTHTMQYERLNGFEAFLRQYYFECFTMGYEQMALEQEAVRTADEVCDRAE
jgi:hypothetical protein